MHGDPLEPDDFSHFSYAVPDAPKGGRARFAKQGTYDSLNPFIVKGVSADGVREYVYETLMARAYDEPFTLYGLIAEAVETHSGEILKFIGDGVLAVFPTGEGLNSAQVCANALNAARHALQTAREAEPPLDLRFGMGMHVGEVLYGNIGSATRIDFTVLGPAVNVAARIEGLCSDFDKPMLFSEEFARLLDVPTELAAKVTLKGQNSVSSILMTREAP